jgi:uncharacterized protein (DUF433 family)
VNTLVDIYGGSDPRDVPAYRVPEAARYLSLPSSTLRAWTFGQRSGGQRFHRVIVPQDSENSLLSFRNLVEAHVLSALRAIHHIPLPRIRRAIKLLAKYTGTERPLIDLPIMTDGANLFVKAYDEGILNASRGGQLEIEQVISAYLSRVESDEHGVVRLFPFTRKRELVDLRELSVQPKVVVIDPRISFGRPVLAQTNIRTAVVAQRYLAGESVEDLATDYGRSSGEIQEAIRCEIAIAA